MDKLPKYFEVVEIKSREDLPKEEDIYWVHSKSSNLITQFSYHANDYIWLREIDYYFLPVTVPIPKRSAEDILEELCTSTIEDEYGTKHYDIVGILEAMQEYAQQFIQPDDRQKHLSDDE